MLSIRKIQQAIQLFSGNLACLLCRQPCRNLICNYCEKDLSQHALVDCQRDRLLTPAVRAGLSQVNFNRLFALSDYQPPASHLIRQLKFSRQLNAGKAMAELFYRHVIVHQNHLPQAILPVPLSNKRLATRGYNQALEIAQHLQKLSKIQLSANSLVRQKHTEAQSSLSAKARYQNLTQAFSLNKPILCDHIALVDDVITTGATLYAACETILHHYPQMRIDLWVMCVTLRSAPED